MPEEILSAHRVCKAYKRQVDGRSFLVEAVKDVDFAISSAEIVGLIGPSGSGKSSVARLLLGLSRPDSGSILYRGQNIQSLRGKELLRFRKDVQVVFQDPSTALNPRKSVFECLAEPLRFHKICHSQSHLMRLLDALLDQVGMDSRVLSYYPHEFSGGEKQRLAIAKAIAIQPQLLIADEAVSALDVSIQAQVLNLLLDLKEQMSVAVLLISHDTDVVEHMSDRILCMQNGVLLSDPTVGLVGRKAF